MTTATLPLPPTITLGTVKGRLARTVTDPVTLDVKMVPAVGALLFSAAPGRLDTTGLTLLPDPILAPLDGDGRFSVDLPATDNPAWQTVAWTWRVSFALDVTDMPAFNFRLEPGVTRDITELVPLARSGGEVSLRGTTATITVAGWEPVDAANAGIDVSGDANNAVWYFRLPTGGKGDTGPRGPAGSGAEGYKDQFLYGGM